MHKQTTKKPPLVSDKYECNLLWSLQPICSWMQVLGIASGQLHTSSAFRRYVVLFLGTVMMIWMILSNIRPILLYFHTGYSPAKVKAAGWTLNSWTTRLEVLQEFQFIFLNISISLSFFSAGHLQWRAVWKKAAKVEYAMRFDETFYRSIRKMSLAAVSLVVLEIVHTAIRFFLTDLSHLLIGSKVLEIGFSITDLYPLSGVVLFACLTWTASMMLQRLIDQLPTDEIPQQMELNQQLVKWKRNLGLINDYIEKINHFFGFILLAFLAKNLFNFITYSYFMMKVIQSNDQITLRRLSIMFTKTVLYVSLPVMASHRIKQKVRRAGQQLRNLKFSDNTVQCQVNFLIIDISINSPKITAMGVFEIGPNLFPSFIGITMTYLIVLWQFEINN